MGARQNYPSFIPLASRPGPAGQAQGRGSRTLTTFFLILWPSYGRHPVLPSDLSRPVAAAPARGCTPCLPRHPFLSPQCP